MDFITDILTNTEYLILFISLIVGFCSIVLTVVTLWWQREHDQLMVRPIGKFQITNTDKEFSIAIENNGLGPLIIKSVNFDRIKDSKMTKEWPPHLLEGIGDHLEICIMRLRPKGFVLYPGKSVYLAQFRILDQDDIQQKTELQTIKDDYRSINEIKLEYTDVYGKKLWVENIPTVIFPS
ncbi:MAG TPA: hypothetical protein P5217_05170 [Methanoregulaceae archaeon]|nr:hypothetical protein [Methanoregulaceae archaeon]HRY75655.1 hypothetical protein [Methanoregulaceae archaeon]